MAYANPDDIRNVEKKYLVSKNLIKRYLERINHRQEIADFPPLQRGFFRGFYMAIKKYLGFLRCLFIEIRSEVGEALAALAQFKAVEQITQSGWND